MGELEQLKKQIEDQRMTLEATLLKYGYESSEDMPTFDDLIQLVREMGSALTDSD